MLFRTDDPAVLAEQNEWRAMVLKEVPPELLKAMDESRMINERVNVAEVCRRLKMTRPQYLKVMAKIQEMFPLDPEDKI